MELPAEQITTRGFENDNSDDLEDGELRDGDEETARNSISRHTDCCVTGDTGRCNTIEGNVLAAKRLASTEGNCEQVRQFLL
jgi:hypothetical protein